MRTRVIQIGRSQGVRIPKAVLEQTGLCGEVDLSVVRNAVVIRASTESRVTVKKPRAGWLAAFARMRKHGDDELLDQAPASLTEWDEKEWEW